MSEKQKGQDYRLDSDDEDDTLREVGEDQEFELEDDVDPAERRRDPLRQPR